MRTVFQRLSGGGAVLTSPNLYSVTTIIPTSHPLAKLDLVNCFRRIGDVWRQTLVEANVDTSAMQ